MITFSRQNIIATPPMVVLQAYPTKASPNPTPFDLGEVQEASIDFTGSNKDLQGRNIFPISSFMASMKGTIKVKTSNPSLRVNGLMWGEEVVKGGQTIATETFTIPDSSGTISVSNGTAFVKTLSVIFQQTSLQLLRGTGPGCYQDLGGGQYTFDETDAGSPIKISYAYTTSDGMSLVFNNKSGGALVQATTDIYVSFMDNEIYLELKNTNYDKTARSFKNDYDAPEYDGTLNASASNEVFNWYSSESFDAFGQ